MEAKTEAPCPDALYFVKVPSGAVKIGRSGNPKKRLKSLQTGCHEPFEWTKFLPGRGGEEKMWHEAFCADRLQGEWFAWTADLGAAIAAECCLKAYERSREGQDEGELAAENVRLRKLLYSFVRNRPDIQARKHPELLATLMDMATDAFVTEPPDWIIGMTDELAIRLQGQAA